MTPYYEHAGITIYHGDCREVLPTLPAVDVVLTDPPYLTNDARVPIGGRGVSAVVNETTSVGMPWGYSLDWLALSRPKHWVVFCNHKMLGGVCTALDARGTVSNVFVWWKPNAPRMTRPVPRFDCEFIVWARADGASCDRMGEFDTSLLPVPMPQAGCFAVERFTEENSGKAAHPTQKPVAVVGPFVARLVGAILDPFMGTGTTLVVAKRLGRKAIGVEIEERYCEMAAERLAQEALPFSAA